MIFVISKIPFTVALAINDWLVTELTYLKHFLASASSFVTIKNTMVIRISQGKS